MPFVIDASVTLAWFFPDERPEYAARVIRRLKTDTALAPEVWPYEVANALLTAEHRSRLAISEAAHIANEARRLPIAVLQASTAQALGRFLDLAREQSLTVYDAAYLELAMREGLALATLDDDLRAAAERVGVPIAEMN